MNARRVARDRQLSRGARLCRQLISLARPGRDGRRYVGRARLASQLRCSQRQVSRYTAELRRAGALTVEPPRRELTEAGWRTVGVNGYTLADAGRRSRSL